MAFKGDGSDHITPKGPEGQDHLAKVRAENTERGPETPRVERTEGGSVKALEGALSAFANAHPDAQKMFLACYSDEKDPYKQKTLALMTGQATLSDLLSTDKT